MGSDVVRVRAVVHGRVQMVGFRAFVIRHARDGGLSGTVRNHPDGTVEAVLEGHRSDVERMLELIRQGPSHARVERVDVDYSNPTGSLPAMMVAS
ncbi:MAG TPA: acylphosphatase [Candidatus Saccharimonadales bacterium]|nr:acylphosphatase [Candidatus Saccharimonadales bacterium]